MNGIEKLGELTADEVQRVRDEHWRIDSDIQRSLSKMTLDQKKKAADHLAEMVRKG